MKQITVRSPAFNDHTMIPAEYSHLEGDVSPPLQWLDVPDDVAELALLCEDPDAPTGTFTHWLLSAIPPRGTALEAGERPPQAVTGRNGFGALGYGGPQPPIGETHRYFFRLYGLSEPAGLTEGFTAEDLHAVVKDTAIATGTLVGTFGR